MALPEAPPPGSALGASGQLLQVPVAGATGPTWGCLLCSPLGLKGPPWHPRPYQATWSLGGVRVQSPKRGETAYCPLASRPSSPGGGRPAPPAHVLTLRAASPEGSGQAGPAPQGPLVQPTSPVQNRIGCHEGWWPGGPGGPTQDQTSGVGTEEGQRGLRPCPLAERGQRQWQGGKGLPGLTQTSPTVS